MIIWIVVIVSLTVAGVALGLGALALHDARHALWLARVSAESVPQRRTPGIPTNADAPPSRVSEPRIQSSRHMAD